MTTLSFVTRAVLLSALALCINKDSVNKDRGNMLMRLFQSDLLPSMSAAILRNLDRIFQVGGGAHDIMVGKSISSLKKYFGWILIISINFMMLLYIYLFATTQSVGQQKAWFRLFTIYLISIIISTFNVYVNSTLIPSFSMKDVYALREMMINIICAGLEKKK